MPKVSKKSAIGPVTKKQRVSQSWTVIEMAEQGKYDSILKQFANGQIPIRDFQTHAVETGDTALHIAASRGHVETVCVLLAILLNVEMIGHQKRTPLHCSAANGHLLVTQRLLDVGAKVDAKDAEGATALHLAEKNGHDGVVLLLAKNGARITEQTIFLAISKGNKDLVEQCLQQEVSVDTLSNKKESLVVYAAREKRWEIVSLLLRKGADPTICKEIKESAIVFAALHGNYKSVKELLHHSIKFNSEQIKCALMFAGNQEVVHAIIDANHELLQNESGTNAFMAAAMEGRLDVMKALCLRGVRVNCTNEKNETALFLSSAKGNEQCVKELIALKADLNIANNRGNTAVHAAAMSNHLNCVRILQEAGANLLVKNRSRKTPFDVAKNPEICKMLPSPQKKTLKRSMPQPSPPQPSSPQPSSSQYLSPQPSEDEDSRTLRSKRDWKEERLERRENGE